MRFLTVILTFGLLDIAYATSQITLGRALLTGRSINGLGVDFFGGIPFAEPPVGQMRLRPPLLKTELGSREFNATAFGKACLQPPLVLNLTDMSEDCLTVNVYKPSNIPKNTKLPVLFWTFGSAFTVGSSSQHDASSLVARSIERGTPVIFVSFNYRLGPFGWPQGQEAEDQQILNLGLHDQLTALKWVQRNIHYFGGDKSKVTAFGQSAGSVMTGLLYLDNQINGLARAAIFQSGQASTVVNPKAAFGNQIWARMVQGVPSCASLATSGATISCLRNATASDILGGWLQGIQLTYEAVIPLDIVQYFPTIDPGPKSLLRDLPSRLYSKGQFARLPFMAGTVLDEGSFLASRGLNTTASDIERLILRFNSPPVVTEDVLEQAVQQVLELYPDTPSLGSPFNTGDELFGLTSSFKRHAAIFGDLLFEGPRRTWIQAATERGVKAYGYLFTQPQPLEDPSAGVPHGSDVPFILAQPQDQSESARKLATSMKDYWISFATTLDPNDSHGDKRPVWPRYNRSNELLLQLNGDNTTTIRDNYRQDNINFFESNPIVFRH